MSTALALISTILLYLALPTTLALAGLALVGLFGFGGARRNALALLAAGTMCALTGGVYLYGVVSSYYALQDNAYLGNLYIGFTLLLIGAPGLLAGGLVGAGLNRWAALGLALAGLAGLVGVYRSIGLDQPNGGRFVALYLVAALVVTLGALLALRRANLAGAALGLGALGALVALAVYLLLAALQGPISFAVFLQAGLDQSLADKPPVLEGFGATITLALAAGVFLLARRRGAPAGANHGATATA